MIGEDFLFNDKWLSNFKMMMCDPDDEQAFVSREIDKANQTAVRSTVNHYTTHYSDVLVLHFFIIKDDCFFHTQNELVLSADELNSLRSWLESPKKPCELYVQSNTNKLDVYYYGIFTDVQPFVVGGNCYGLKMTFTCNAPYGFSPLVDRTLSVAGQDGTFNMRYPNLSAEYNEYLRPKITITSQKGETFSGNEKIVITNVTDNNNSMSITLPAGKSKLIIDCNKKVITDENGFLVSLSEIKFSPFNSSDNSGYYNIISAETGSIYWLRFLSGNNQLTVSSENAANISDVHICAQYPIKAGEF